MNTDPFADLGRHLNERAQRIKAAENARLAEEQRHFDALYPQRKAVRDALQSSVIPELKRYASLLQGYTIKATVRFEGTLETYRSGSSSSALSDPLSDFEATLTVEAGASHKDHHSISFHSRATETSWCIRCVLQSKDPSILNAFNLETWTGIEEPELSAWAAAKTAEFIKLSLP